jgi:hypothetical protein
LRVVDAAINRRAMKVVGSYSDEGYALLQGLVPSEVTMAFLQRLKQDIGPAPIPLSKVAQHPNLLARPAFEITAITIRRCSISFGA